MYKVMKKIELDFSMPPKKKYCFILSHRYPITELKFYSLIYNGR